MLINELNHRVKNTLSIVQSLAYQTLRGADVPVSVREAFTGRLVALAEAHDLLNGEKWAGASLNGVLLQAIQAQALDMVDRIHLDGPELRLDPKQALSIAMGTHELLSNAIKYGALSTSSGSINISWRVYGEAPMWMELSWWERGGPQVVAPIRSGFGSRLIQRGLPAELEGEASLFFASEGVRCVINAPLTMAS
ncbi:sensor histidine kinase (plasmid) [Pseudomonas sp. HR96]|uniref:sensor histidine kinase n=1 Tax=Pseudomonas sp. HR96 TaxID=1027966 RepID=UPI002A747A4B|nr:sensor histidine kinase [Pseudomonas sp. HR96]WPP02396.1 sensor histidine kinase [Pseudomonas sp. HR96]